MTQDGYVSADSHVVEPGDLWVKRMDKRYRDRAPRTEARADGDYYIIEGLDDFPVSLEGASMEDKIKGEINKSSGYRQSDSCLGSSSSPGPHGLGQSAGGNRLSGFIRTGPLVDRPPSLDEARTGQAAEFIFQASALDNLRRRSGRVCSPASWSACIA